MSLKAPCLNCKDRTITCHAECIKYLAFKIANDKLKEERCKNNDLKYALYDINKAKYKKLKKGDEYSVMINLGDTGLMVQYIQNFLKDNYNPNIHLSDEYDKTTHKALIEYLRLPEIIDSYSMKDLILKNFTFREEQPPNLLIDGGGVWNFDFDITLDTIRFYTRALNQCLDGGIKFISEYMDDVDELCRQHGWYLSYYTKFVINENTNNIVEFILVKESREQLLPTKDIIKMINFSMNDYLIGKCFLDENNAYHGIIQNSNMYKISYISIKPGDKFTISHGYNHACELAIGYTECTLQELKTTEYTYVQNIVSRLNKSVLGELKPGDYEIYEIPKDSDAKYLLIQMPYKDTIISPTSQKITIQLGDINQDGIIDFDENNPESDYMLLKRYVEAKAEGKDLPFTLSDMQMIAANINRDIDINGRPVIDESDLKKFEDAKNSGLSIDFGEIVYEKEIELSESDYDRLLVMYGNIEENNNGNELNIPLIDYQTEPWLIHDCFLPYLLGSAIHTYSNTEDINWLQNLIMKIQPKYKGLHWGFYDTPESFVSNDYFRWNKTKAKYEYYINGLYSGYILSSNDLFNSEIRRESNLTLIDSSIVNGRILNNGVWTGQLVLEDGTITKELSQYSLKEIIKQFQIMTNDYYKDKSKEQIKFITGFVDPLTEKRLKQLIQ